MGEPTFWQEIGTGIKRIFTKAVGLLSSRKFAAAVAGTVLVLNEGAELETTLNRIAAIWITYIVSVALEDGLSRR